jgi:GAF domain-containing protein
MRTRVRRTPAPKRSESQAAKDLNMLAEVLSGGVGELHLRTLAASLGQALNAQMVLIGQVAGASGEMVETVALYRDGKIAENIRYALHGTPCETVLSTGICVYKSKVSQQFPRDHALKELRAEAYVGMPLIDSLGRVLGLLAVIFSKPLRDAARATTLLRIFGARAALELERNLMDQHMFRQLTAGL